jgi:hypothetical protein
VRYQPLLRGKVPRFGVYTLDPVNQIDRYEVYFSDGTGVYHDFVTGDGGTMDGDYTAGRTLTGQDTSQYHVLAKRHIYTQAGQPDVSGKEMYGSEDFTAPSTKAITAITGEWRGHWITLGMEDVRKEFIRAYLLGDGGNTTIEWYADMIENIGGNKQATTRLQVEQSATLWQLWRYAMSQSMKYAIKLVVVMVGSNADSTYPAIDEYLTLAPSLTTRGAIFGIKALIGSVDNSAD